MSNRYLTLSRSGYSVRIDFLTVQQAPRSPIKIGEISYTSEGTMVHNGIIHLERHQWEIRTLLNEEKKLTLDTLYDRQERDRRAGQDPDNYAVTVDDTFEYFVEAHPRTRQIVSGTTAIALPNAGAPTDVAYFARFRAVFDGRPQYAISRGNEIYEATIFLKETKPLLIA